MMNSEYQLFLNVLKGCSKSSYCQSCPSHLHVRHWIPAPCSTSHFKDTPKSVYNVKSSKNAYFLAKKQGEKRHLPRHRMKKHQSSVPKFHDSSKENVVDEEMSAAHSLDLHSSSTNESYSGALASTNSHTDTSSLSNLLQPKGKINHDKILRLLLRDLKQVNRLKGKNTILKKKVAMLKKQLKAQDIQSLLMSEDWLENLIKNYENILVKSMKLEEEKKGLEMHIKQSKKESSTKMFKEVAVQTSRPLLSHKSTQDHCSMDIKRMASIKIEETGTRFGSQLEEASTSYIPDNVSRPTLQQLQSVGIQCILVDIDKIVASSSAAMQQMEEDIVNDFSARLDEAKHSFDEVIQKYKQQLADQRLASKNREIELQATIEKLQEALEKKHSSREEQQHGAVLSVEQLQTLLDKYKLGDKGDGTFAVNLHAIQQMIEESLTKWHELRKQENASSLAARESVEMRDRHIALASQVSSLTRELEQEKRWGDEIKTRARESDSKLQELQHMCSQQHHKELEHLERHQRELITQELKFKELQNVVEALQRDKDMGKAEVTALTTNKSNLEREILTKDKLIESLKLQLDEVVKKNCSLNTELEKRCSEMRSLTDSLQNNEEKLQDLTAESRAKVQGLQEALRQETASKEQLGMQYEGQIRKLRLDLDQMRVRNETFQRQLAAITSTYHNLFATTDASDTN